MSREPAADRGRIREYLLRNLAEADRSRFEESYFTDDALLDRIETEEDLLVSDYVLGRLSEEDRRRFEQALLATPYYRQRVETTARLRLRIADDRGFRRLARAPVPGGGGLFPGRTGAVVAFALLGVLLLASLVTALRLKEQLTARGDQPIPAGAAADLAVRLPAGVPEPGRAGATLWADGAPALSTLLEIVAPSPPDPR